MRDLIQRNKNLFILFFVTFFVFLKNNSYIGGPPSSGAPFEQWVNITNQMLYGSYDFMFSYGPLYWVLGGAVSPYSIYSLSITIIFISLINAMTTTIVGALIIRKSSYIYAILLYCLFMHSITPSIFLLPLLALFFIEYYNDAPIELNFKICIFLGMYIGLAFYIRYLYGVIGLAVVGSYLVGLPIFNKKFRVFEHGKKILVFSLSVIITFIILGFFIFHHPHNIINYVIINNQLSFGNSVDMTLQIHNPWFTWLMVFISYVCLAIYSLKYKRNLFLPITLIFLILFKLGFSRADHYYEYFIIPIATIGIVTAFNKTFLSKVLSTFIFISLLVICNYGWSPHKTFVPSMNYKISYADRMQNIYKDKFTLPNKIKNLIGNSTVDTYPTNNEYVFANKLNYVHRPSFQSYMTLTPKLDMMNQKFLESSSRPDFIIWNELSGTFGGFDGKYGLNENPLTLSSILLNYHVVDVFKDSAGREVSLLQKNSKITMYSQTFLKKQSMEFNKWYKIPKNNKRGVIKLIPNFNFTLLGQVKNLMFRGSILTISYKFKNGGIKTYKLNILNSYSGIWVSPYLNSIVSQDNIEAIKINTSNDYYIDKSFKAAWVIVPIKTPIFKGVMKNFGNSKLSKLSINIDRNIKISSSIERMAMDGNFLNIEGWAYINNKDANDTNTYLILKDKTTNQKYYYVFSKYNRPDVAKVFNNGVSLEKAGINLNTDISNIKDGTYTMSIYARGIDGYGSIIKLQNQLTKTADDNIFIHKGNLAKPVNLNLSDLKKLPATDIKFNLENITYNKPKLSLEGWGYIENLNTENSKIYIKLYNSKHSYIYSSNILNRSDVAKTFKNKDLVKSGFNIDLLANIPKGIYKINLIIVNQNKYVDIYSGKNIEY
ncbi:hypothetical protein [Francisella sp. SYW-2]|uniref:hypothetical protein n=1 Tax=Francisella sp. SYW-2 TaxID=2610886 RepID=UPI00123C8B65|nr:hypothetical protein [Francisella sp. SYW-2]